MANRKLEEIFWQRGWVNEKGKEVKPSPIGLPIHVINLKNRETIPENHPIFDEYFLQNKGSDINEINAYAKNIYLGCKENEYTASVQFYKI